MIDHTHYVPMVRWKAAEKKALADLLVEHSSRLTPLVEFVPKWFARPEKKQSVTVDRMVRRVVSELVEYWGDQQSILLDFEYLDNGTFYNSSALHVVQAVCQDARLHHVIAIPVTGLKRSRDYQSSTKAICAKSGTGLCIRLRPADFQRKNLLDDLLRLTGYCGVDMGQVDLVVDLQAIDSGQARISEYCAHVPFLDRWRSFIWASGAFPRDLQAIKPGQKEINRFDWVVWREDVLSGLLPRQPAFSDYTIQFGLYREPPTSQPNPSASIRYTCDDYWVVMRGRALYGGKTTGHAQYPPNAQMLIRRKEFMGPEYSAGDQYIYDISQKQGGPGTPGTWLQAGINHHMTHVVRQIASLYDIELSRIPLPSAK